MAKENKWYIIKCTDRVNFEESFILEDDQQNYYFTKDQLKATKFTYSPKIVVKKHFDKYIDMIGDVFSLEWLIVK